MKSKSDRFASRWGIPLLIATMLASFIPVPAQVQAEQNETQNQSSTSVIRTVTIDTNNVIQDDFLGVGVNTIPTALMPGQMQYGYTEAHWEIDKNEFRRSSPK